MEAKRPWMIASLEPASSFRYPTTAADLAVAAIDAAERIALRFLPHALPRLAELILRHTSSGVRSHGHSDYLGDVGSCRHGDRRVDLGPHKTIRDLHEMMKTRGGVDPLGEFSVAARDELTAVKSR
jgi:hypothetical protein